jgi:AraC-like DNA-binding protein
MKTLTLSYPEVESRFQQTSEDVSGFIHRTTGQQSWGAFEEKVLTSSHYRFMEYSASPAANFNIQYNEAQLPHCMNICIALQGMVEVKLRESGLSAALTGLRHHSLYSYEQEYDLIVNKNIHGIHVAIEREYYANLLCDQTRWTATLKEKLLKQELVMHGDATVDKDMQQVIATICNNPLGGNLRKLLIEAKMLELVALQISQFIASDKKQTDSTKLKRPDIDTFHDLRKYLDQHFAEDLSLHALSRMFGLNEFKLKKGFKDIFHSTVFDYIYECRMNHAQYLLRDQKKYVNEVSAAVGYKNPNHFSTAFKRKFGTRPSEIAKLALTLEV